jgi:hypothetical protein
MRWLVAVVLMVASTSAHAGNDLANWLVGPVIGVQISGRGGVVLGIEGGGGYGPERFNLGFEHRYAVDHGTVEMGYIEVDPWYILGGTAGIGVQSDGKVEPVLGVWEGLPLSESNVPCSGWHTQVTISGGYRYTGAHELYLTVKAGYMDGKFCID